MQVGQYGQLQEWFEDWDNPKDHRHISHLWGFFPEILYIRPHLLRLHATP
ncbi:MAG: glycosyl hydrolase family 95 catalytic domain-containing protein [Bacteroides cellulosilyticus]